MQALRTIRQMKKIEIFILLIVSISLLWGCYYDNEEALYGVPECSAEPVTYSTKISSIISKNCISCHSTAAANGGITLETYAHVKSQADNGKLVGSVTHASGFSPMPKNAPQLSECDITAIRNWVQGGSLNNSI